jgi:protein-tyrosine phosphatase
LRRALVERQGENAPAVSSAGTAGWEGSPATPESVAAAAERGTDISDHLARRLTTDMIEEADLVVGLSAEHREAVVRLVPGSGYKTFTLKELGRLLEALPAGTPTALHGRVESADRLRRSGFGGNPLDEDVVDPLGMPMETYRAIAWEIQDWSTRVADGLAGQVHAKASDAS